MKHRLPTPEERRLWRESNRFTTRHGVDSEDEAEEEADTAFLPEDPVAAAISRSAAPVSTHAPTTPAKAPLKLLTTREANRFFNPYPLDATLDLHGLTKLEAHARVAAFIHHQQRAGRRHVLIITGKGRGGEAGVLRSNLPHWLNEAPLRGLISALAHARPEKGGAGVLHVLLKSRTP